MCGSAKVNYCMCMHDTKIIFMGKCEHYALAANSVHKQLSSRWLIAISGSSSGGGGGDVGRRGSR